MPDWNLIRELYNKGLPLRKIAEQFNLQVGTVASRASRGNWKRIAAEATTIAQNALIETKEKPAAESAVTKHSEAAKAGLAGILARSVEKLQAIALNSPKAALKANAELESVVRNCKTVFGWSEGQSTPAVRINLLGSFTVQPKEPALPQAPVIDVTPVPDSGQGQG